MGSKGTGHCPVSLGGWYPGTLEARGTCARYPGNQPGTTAASVLHTVGVRKPSMTSSKPREVSKWAAAFAVAPSPFI